MTLQLSRDEIRAAIYGLAAVQRARAAAGAPVPHPVITARQHLEAAYRCGVSPPRHQNGAFTEELEEWIGTRLAAQVLGWHPRRVQRHRGDLDGRLVGGRLVFPAVAVREYAKQIGAQRD